LVNRHIDPASTRELEALQKRVEAQLVIIDKKIEKAERRLSNEPPPAKQEEFVQAEIVPPPVDIRSRENGRRNAYSPTTRESPPVIVTAANSESFIDWLLAKFKSFGKMIPGAQCPACKENWVKEVFEKRLVESRQAYRTVTRRDKHYNKHSGQFVGTKVGETRRKEQVVVTVSTFLLSCHCKNCGHAWTEQQDEER